MNVIAFNGSPRKKWNTATLLEKALEGASSKGAETELIHLYDLNYKGCKSCFACKTKGGKSYGRCAVKDDLTPVFKRVEEADAFIAVTQGDNRNVMSTQIAKHIYHVPKVLCRIYDPLRRELYNSLGIEAISPTIIFAQLLKEKLET